MALFRKDSGIETIKNSCPICRSDVKGNDVYLYFCQHCNILFRKEDLILTSEAVNKILKEKVAEKFTKDPLPIEKPILEKNISEDHKKLLNTYHSERKYFVSKKSNVIHASNCPYGKNIKKENRIVLRSIEGTKYKKCRCLNE